WLVCVNCGKSFLRQPSQISTHNYCSQSCAATVNNRGYPKRKAELKTCVRCNKQFKRSKGNLKYCSVKCRVEAERRYTPEQLIDIIKLATQELKRVPAKRELKEIADICARSFGSWNNAIIAAGLQPNRSHSQRMYKRTTAKAVDGHICDSISELLIDNWLTKNKIKHERNAPYPNTNHRSDWVVNLQGKTIFVEYFGLAKDSPRYDRSIRKKKSLCQKYKIKLLEVYPWDLYPGIKLDDKLKILKK
ncbi:MAG: hypothetical protein Q8L57_00575, partial [bacterium]|nr:hypothetical protein [bacterium]